MFMQFIEAKAADADTLDRLFDRWQSELAPGATGWLGATGGTTDDGRFVVAARFESAEAAQANSARPEQGAWWSEVEKCFDGAPSFLDCDDVTTVYGQGSDDAGFVQVMRGRCTDPARYEEIERAMLPAISEQRPEIMGLVRGWSGSEVVEVAYFTSEAEARKGESAEMPDDVAAMFEEYQRLVPDIRYFDLTNPRLDSP